MPTYKLFLLFLSKNTYILTIKNNSFNNSLNIYTFPVNKSQHIIK